jgi:hypothetical protein
MCGRVFVELLSSCMRAFPFDLKKVICRFGMTSGVLRGFFVTWLIMFIFLILISKFVIYGEWQLALESCVHSGSKIGESYGEFHAHTSV